MSVLPTLSKTYDKVDVLERPVPISSIKDIKGFFGYRMEVNRNYLEDFPIDKYVDFVVQRQHTALRTTQPHAADGKAATLQERVFTRFFEAAEIAKFTVEEYHHYETS